MTEEHASNSQTDEPAEQPDERSESPGEDPPSFRWKNFRGFEDTKWFELRPIVIIIGANNTGKSSLLAPLLAMKQTFDSATSTPFISRGTLTNIGNFKDFVYRHDVSRTVWLDFRFHHHPVPDHTSPIEESPPGEIQFGFDTSDGGTNTRLRTIRILDPNERLYLERTRTESGKYSLENLELNPVTEADEKLKRRIMEAAPRGSTFEGSEVFLMTEGAKDLIDEVSDDFRKRVFLYAGVVDTARIELRRLLRSISYIGPMRERPARYYEHLGDMPRTVGARGEHTAEVLYRHKASGIVDSITAWVKRFGLGDELICSEAIDEVFDLKLRLGGTTINIADCGFGVSQLLPILVEGLSGNSTTVVVKQPEIHLNPAQQCTFAEFVAECVSAERGRKKRIVLETHSEHLLLTIRRLIAERVISNSDVALYFVERDVDISSVREIPIDSNGNIAADQWPHGFFGDALKQGLALAAAQMRGAN